jgi:CRP-like cAMP-binding protein
MVNFRLHSLWFAAAKAGFFSEGAALPNEKRDSVHSRAALQPGADGEVNKHVENRILLSLPRAMRSALLAKSQFVHLPIHTVLNEAGVPIQHVYFINHGLASILCILRTGKSVEVGLSGREGFVGLPLVFAFNSSPTRVIMQLHGTAFRISARDFAPLLKSYPLLQMALQRYSQEVALQAAQTAACNRLHEIDQRLARWLLMSQDRMDDQVIPLTQEFLAHMLGTRRASVTVAAGRLQKAGLISYLRGQLKIEDRERLEIVVCECYKSLKEHLEAWTSESA